MPALVNFGRKWLAASDDFVIPYAIEAALRKALLCASLVILYFVLSDSTSSVYVRYFLYAFIIELFVTLCLCITISVISSRGSVLQIHKRSNLPIVLNVKLLSVSLDATLASYLTWLLIYGPDISPYWKIFLEAAAVFLWLYVLAVILATFVFYNSLGSPKYWNNNHTNSVQVFKKAEKIWRLRLKFFCCCADVSEEENDFIYVEIANFLTTFSCDIDLTPSDVLAGLIVLVRKHAIEKRRKNYQQNHSDVYSIIKKPIPSWMTAENALYYLRLAKSTYGWMAFFDTFRPWNLCLLLSPKCFTSCSNNTKHGDCCNCNMTAFRKISRLSVGDVLYASFSSSIHEPAFVVTLHHDTKSVVIAIRGTRSFSDLVTDINMEEMDFPNEMSSQKLSCHRGSLRSALFIQRRLQELNILKMVFEENPSYDLVLTGHSLGGSIASILGLLLQPEYPSLRCFSYAPLAVLCSEGVTRTLDFVFCVVVGDDMVPCTSAKSFKELFQQLYKSLEETEIPKYKILTKACKNYLKKCMKMTPKIKCTSFEGQENVEVEVEEAVQQVEIDMNHAEEMQLYAPGRILHLKKSESGSAEFCWTTGLSFHTITISLHMIKDHQPHYIQSMLEECKSRIDPLKEPNNI